MAKETVEQTNVKTDVKEGVNTAVENKDTVVEAECVAKPAKKGFIDKCKEKTINAIVWSKKHPIKALAIGLATLGVSYLVYRGVKSILNVDTTDIVEATADHLVDTATDHVSDAVTDVTESVTDVITDSVVDNIVDNVL